MGASSRTGIGKPFKSPEGSSLMGIGKPFISPEGWLLKAISSEIVDPCKGKGFFSQDSGGLSSHIRQDLVSVPRVNFYRVNAPVRKVSVGCQE